jgi:dsDNA-specific endonuclease/ATPase MutS2
MTVDEAVRAMKNVITANIGRSVLINHGKGTGTLRTAVRLLCKNDPRVKKIRNGEEVLLLGTDGVTVIEL